MRPLCLWALTRSPSLHFTHWVYKDLAESRLAMEGVNFFDNAISPGAVGMRSGDMITLVAKDGWTIAGISVDREYVYLHPMSRTTK